MSLPASMWAVQPATAGPPDVLRKVSVAVPQAGVRQVLVEVHFAGMSRGDLMQRVGRYPPAPGVTPTLGLEVAGTVVAVGGEVTRWNVGDAVCALVPGGGYAQYCIAEEDLAFAIPAALSLQEAAALPESACTIWATVFEQGRLQAGDDLLVHGGASSIGTMVVQLATAFGARVFATAGTPQKCSACRALGAAAAIDYREQDFVREIDQLTAGRGVDVILDMVGGDYFGRNMAAAAVEGRIVSISFLQGARADVDFGPMLRKRLTLTGSSLRGRTPQQKAAIAQSVRESFWPLWNDGRLRPVIHAVFDMQDVVAAHALMESGVHTGKLLLRA